MWGGRGARWEGGTGSGSLLLAPVSNDERDPGWVAPFEVDEHAHESFTPIAAVSCISCVARFRGQTSKREAGAGARAGTRAGTWIAVGVVGVKKESTSIDKVCTVVNKLKPLRCADQTQHSALRNPAPKVIQIALNVGDIPDLEHIAAAG